MNASRTALLAAAGAAAGLIVWTNLAPAASPPHVCPEDAAAEKLAAVAAAHGDGLADGRTSYVHFGGTTVAHAPLASMNDVTEDDLAQGAEVMAVFVRGDESGRVPDGAYVVRLQFDPGADRGTATYVDGEGRDVVKVEAFARTRDQINGVFDDAYDPPPVDDPPAIPVITSTHVWRNGRYMVDCTGPGWGWKVYYY